MPVNPQHYNPQGALGGTFAPAYIAGYAPSEQAVQAWQANRGMQGLRNQGVQSLDELRMPLTPAQLRTFSGSVEQQQGAFDPEALRAIAQNRPYDVQGQRDRIAEILALRSADPTLGPSQVAGIGPALEAALRAIPGAWERFALGGLGTIGAAVQG